MPMDRNEHEATLAELLKPDLEMSRRTELLDLLRTVNNTDLHEFSVKEETLSKLEKEKEDLVVSNSMLFRKLGIEKQTKDEQKEMQEKTFSETITLENLEGGK